MKIFMIWPGLRSQHFCGFLPKPERFIYSSINPINDVADDMEMNDTLPTLTEFSVTDTHLDHFHVV